MKKKVAHYKFTGVCHAPDQLVKCINKYSDRFEAILVTCLQGSVETDIHELIPIQHIIDFSNFDIVHFHNKYTPTNKPALIQYHSPSNYVDLDFKGFKTVIAQYQATLCDYNDCMVVRNIIDFESKEYNQIYEDNEKIRIGFAPTTKLERGDRTNVSKGYIETEEILQKICSKYKNVEYDLMYEIPFDECIRRKSRCDIIIDECVTKSYHRNALEGLALGKLTICSLGSDVKDIFKKISGSSYVPLVSLWIEELTYGLEKIINNGIDYIKEQGKHNRIWMEKYWHPKQIVNEFESIYMQLLNIK